MFHMIRQNASGSPAVLIRLLETLRRVIAVETCVERRAELLRHGELAMAAGRLGIATPPISLPWKANASRCQGADMPRQGARR
jgi:hypothetical protein